MYAQSASRVPLVRPKSCQERDFVILAAAPLSLTAQALTIARVQDFARKNSLTVEERERAYHRDFVLSIPADRLNDILWELDLEGLLRPNQVITGDPSLHVRLEERFSWLEWVDGYEDLG